MKCLCDPQIIPTVVPQDVADIELYATRCSDFSTWLHVDIADGAFAQNTTWPFVDPFQKQELESLKGSTPRIPQSMSLEAHLMVAEPTELGEQLARVGFTRISGHIEAFESAEHARVALDAWRSAGTKEAGIAMKIGTPLAVLENVTDVCDFIHVMSIQEIGEQGHAFDERILSHVEEIHALYPDMMVAVDGGVSEASVEELVRAGANRLIIGHALADSSNPAKTYMQILERAQKGCAPLSGVVV